LNIFKFLNLTLSFRNSPIAINQLQYQSFNHHHQALHHQALHHQSQHLMELGGAKRPRLDPGIVPSWAS
jgi:hypothetical protein